LAIPAGFSHLFLILSLLSLPLAAMADIQLPQLSSGAVPRAAEASLSSDACVDRQYISKGSEDTDYIKQPWRHCQDSTKSYLSLRQHQKLEFLEKLEQEVDEGPKKKERIVYELNRINKVRKRFETNAQLRTSLDDLKTLYEEWKAAVDKAVPDITREIQVDQQKKSRKSHNCLKEDTELLGDLSKWPFARGPTFQSAKPDKPERRPSWFNRTRSDGRRQSQIAVPNAIPETPERPTEDTTEEPELEPYYGFKASAMYFQKTDEGHWRGHTNRLNPRYKGTSFPNQKISIKDILEENEDNPLMEKCPDDEFRYFHFPTNNMSWIEVIHVSTYFV
jgi:hypothetical protein